jgi:predicted lipid-binding transport protein (Tim44 family)
MERDRRRVTEATAAAAVVSGAPSTLHAVLTTHSLPATAGYVRDATRAIGTLVPPGRPGLARGAIIHLGISAAAAEALARALPRRRSAAWGAAAGLAMGVVNVGLIGRLFPAIRALPLIPQLADHIAFGTVFALVADRGIPALRSAPPRRAAAGRTGSPVTAARSWHA